MVMRREDEERIGGLCMMIRVPQDCYGVASFSEGFIAGSL